MPVERDPIGWKIFEKLPDELKKAAYEAVDEVLSKRTQTFAKQLRKTTPVSANGKHRGSTKASITIEKVDKKTLHGGNVIGYKVYYDGYHLPELTTGKKRAFQLIANSLNRGFYNNHGYYIPGRYFIDKAVTLLRGIDDEIDEKFNKKIEKIKIGG